MTAPSPAAAAPARPWLARAWRWRYLALLGWGVFWMLPPNHYTLGNMNDWIPFEVGARTLVHYHHMPLFETPALHLYVDSPLLQFGPLPIYLLACFQAFPPHAVAAGFGIAMIAMGLAAMAALESAARATLPGWSFRQARRVFWLEVLLIPVWSFEVGFWHHLDDVLALLCVAVAVSIIARRGSWLLLGLLLGTAAATKPWAIVFAPLLLALPRDQWAKAMLALIGIGIAWWFPFVAAAPGTVHALGRYPATPNSDSVLYLLGVHTNCSAWVRLLQFGLGAGAVAVLSHRQRIAQALVVGVALRILLDPYAYSYYALAPLLAAFFLDVSAAVDGPVEGARRKRLPRWSLSTLALVWALARLNTTTSFWHVTLHSRHLPLLIALTRMVWALMVIGWVIVRLRRKEPRAALTPRRARWAIG